MKIDENYFYYQGVMKTSRINFYHFSSSLIPLAEPKQHITGNKNRITLGSFNILL